jgi:hypothetical protein
MSPTQFAVRSADLNKQLEAARSDGDIHRIQRALSGLTSLNRSINGLPTRS